MNIYKEEEKIDSLEIGEFIKAERLKQGISRFQLSFATGIDPSMIYRYEKGEVQMRFETANILLSSLGYEIVLRGKGNAKELQSED